MSNDKEKNKFLKDGTELLLGLDLNGRWSVSQWDSALNLLSSSKFKQYEDANKFFKDWK